MIIDSKLSDEELLAAICKAASEYSKLVGNTYLVIGKNRNSDYFWFQCQFEKKHFMHLLGIDSKTLSASEFYDKCNAHNEGERLTIADCSPSRNHSRTTINEKISCCSALFRISEAKYMKVGLKDKISQLVDFTYGYGNTAILGFKKIGYSSVPITLIPKSIDEFVNKKYRIIFVLQKSILEMRYNNIVVEVKKGLFSEVYTELPIELQRICEKVSKNL